MSRKPALCNEALAGFFRSTEAVAKQRAEAGAERARPVIHTRPGLEPNPLAGGPPDDTGSDRDWLTGPHD
jgi:hypothetical protein